ncbi:Transposase and inactivated derivatives [Alloiococcus otitis]|uniref:transposase family protein n=1 Tax=Alloiococcus otitis TaxID=1652 RepID=UPI000E1430ED|nr:transposase family protein [Alloiococcus otitis]SUU80163.1 Transposase and inactivated derivatives [Alloiococcus otitis]
MPHQHDIRNLIQIQDENIIFQEPMTEEREVKGQAALILHATLTYTPHCCAKCGVVNQDCTIIKNGTQESMITLPFHPFKPFYLCLRKQRFYCRSCGKTFMASTHLVNFNCFIANPLKAGVAFEASRAVSYKDIAERFNISWSSVARFARLAAKERRRAPKACLPTYPLMNLNIRKGKWPLTILMPLPVRS